jgi:regulator of sigma E protease
MVTYVFPDSPAEKAGLKEGNVLVSVGGKTKQSIEDIQNATDAAAGQAISVEYTHGSESKSAEIVPISGLVTGKYTIGIAMDNVVDLKLPFFTAVSESLRYTLTLIKETFVSLYGFIADIFRGAPNFSEVTGPVGIAGIVGNAAQLGFTYLLMVTALISINLGVVNLIPFPALDGGRILVVAIEGAVRRRIPAKIINTVNLVGFALLMLLMVLVTWQDIARLIK